MNIFLAENKTLSASLMCVKDQNSRGIKKAMVQPLESHIGQTLINMQVEKTATKMLLWLQRGKHTHPG